MLPRGPRSPRFPAFRGPSSTANSRCRTGSCILRPCAHTADTTAEDSRRSSGKGRAIGNKIKTKTKTKTSGHASGPPRWALGVVSLALCRLRAHPGLFGLVGPLAPHTVVVVVPSTAICHRHSRLFRFRSRSRPNPGRPGKTQTAVSGIRYIHRSSSVASADKTKQDKTNLGNDENSENESEVVAKTQEQKPKKTKLKMAVKNQTTHPN